mmetsp:Transcript_70077/g.227335  ORF Transcript_70077/g.227335 Transcript_70077/m.227335 type:complete len:278 (+) Transcript_70077:693-1526(+)
MPSAARIHLEELGARHRRGRERRSDRSPLLGAQRQPRRPAAPPQRSREALPRLVQQHPVLAVARAFHPEAHRIPSSAVVSRAEGDIIDAHLMRCCEKNHALLVRAEVYVQPLSAPHKKLLNALAGRRLAQRVGRDEAVETQHGALASQAQLRDLCAQDRRRARGQHREPQALHAHKRRRSADGGGRRGYRRRGHVQGPLGGHGDHARGVLARALGHEASAPSKLEVPQPIHRRHTQGRKARIGLEVVGRLDSTARPAQDAQALAHVTPPAHFRRQGL